MALEEDKQQQQQQQTKRINGLHSSEPSEDPHSAITILPVEMIFDILKRLPWVGLGWVANGIVLRLRSVCKLWCSIVSDPHFIKSHLTFSTININRSYAHHRLLFRTRPPRRSIKSCPLYDVLYGGSVNAVELDCPLKDALKYVSIAGSCNGLLLLTDQEDTLFIWNPSTRRSNRLPNYGFKKGRGCWRHEMYGFGYDESTDDYKVVGISTVLRKDSDGARRDTIVHIYSLKTGYWKKIDDFRNCIPFELSVKYLNGALHWAAGRESGSSYSFTIISLDLAKETYGEILQPVYDDGYTNMRFGAVGEWLCVFCDYDNIRADAWVMKVYGVKDSWTKLLSISFDPTDPHGGIPDDYSVPLCISNDGKILLQFRSKLVVYDSKDCSSSEIQNFDKCLEAYTFVESLVSPISLRAGAGDNNNDG